MAETKKRTSTKKPAKKPATKTTAKKAEFETGEVILADELDELEKNDTVTVCSNFPRDITFEVKDRAGRTVEILIKGNSGHLRGKAAGVLPLGAYGITMNVPKEAWEQISSIYKEDARIKKGLIFATKASNARAEAKERKALRNGYEPIDEKQTKVKANEG
jgi:hypothetical protein